MFCVWCTYCKVHVYIVLKSLVYISSSLHVYQCSILCMPLSQVFMCVWLHIYLKCSCVPCSVLVHISQVFMCTMFCVGAHISSVHVYHVLCLVHRFQGPCVPWDMHQLVYFVPVMVHIFQGSCVPCSVFGAHISRFMCTMFLCVWCTHRHVFNTAVRREREKLGVICRNVSR